ncbi:MAG: hypothetical protein Q8R47_02725 [Nanoarchaeota archaeon]|nr:hypothetical protein [Nanoarchaeota archaeon]
MSENNSNLETKLLETWSTLDYRADRWGPERIVFDAISNHFPEDCGGTAYQIIFVQDGEYLDFQQYDQSKPIDTIFFRDNGAGYDYIHTVLQYSNKADRETQTGRFGEGLKLISAAALRHDVEIEFASQNWAAQPFSKKLFLPSENKEVNLLCQKVIIGYEQLQGSYTCIQNPSQEIIEQVLSFQEHIIDFREDLPGREVQDLHPQHRVFLPEQYFSGELFVKKIKYFLQKPLYLTYQINGSDADSLLSPDRDHVLEHHLRLTLRKLVLRLKDTDLITSLLDTTTPECLEKNISVSKSDKIYYPEQWRKAFYDLYGPKAVLAERGNPLLNEDATTQGFAVVKGLPTGIEEILHHSGIKKVSEVSSRKLKYEILDPARLTDQQRSIYDLHKAVDEVLFDTPLPAEVHIFSRAFDEHGEATWFRGMSEYGLKDKKKSRIYIKANELQDPQSFLETYAHEAVHVYTKAVDLTTEFEEGLTKAIGKVLEAYLTSKS